MFERILVPLDGSPRAECALPEAARIARAGGGTVMLLSVVAPLLSPGKFTLPEVYPKKEIDEELAEAAEYLKTLVASHQLDGLTTETHTIVGDVAPTILAAAESLRTDLIVLWSHGYTGLKRWALGSIAHKLVSHSPVPILVLRDDGPQTTEAEPRPVRALVALDGSLFSEAILKPVAELTAELAATTSQQGTLQVLQVVDIPSGYGKFRRQIDASYDLGVRAEARQKDQQYLEAVARRFAEGDLAPYHLAITTTVVTNPDVAEAIVQAAGQDQVDLIAMATHGRGGVQRWALGSVTERVLHASKVPLFLLRPQAR